MKGVDVQTKPDHGARNALSAFPLAASAVTRPTKATGTAFGFVNG
jgi:hypothetical protein